MLARSEATPAMVITVPAGSLVARAPVAATACMVIMRPRRSRVCGPDVLGHGLEEMFLLAQAG
jgi:hypothetical protein